VLWEHVDWVQFPAARQVKSSKMKKVKAEKREQKKKIKMRVSGKSVFKIRDIIVKKSKEK
jgi:hypothetical protein